MHLGFFLLEKKVVVLAMLPFMMSFLHFSEYIISSYRIAKSSILHNEHLKTKTLLFAKDYYDVKIKNRLIIVMHLVVVSVTNRHKSSEQLVFTEDVFFFWFEINNDSVVITKINFVLMLGFFMYTFAKNEFVRTRSSFLLKILEQIKNIHKTNTAIISVVFILRLKLLKLTTHNLSYDKCYNFISCSNFENGEIFLRNEEQF